MFSAVFVLRGLQSARPPPLPDGTFKARDEPFGRGELCQGSVVCVMCSRLLCPYGLFPVLPVMSLLVKYVPAVFVSLCVNYPVYISPVF